MKTKAPLDRITRQPSCGNVVDWPDEYSLHGSTCRRDKHFFEKFKWQKTSLSLWVLLVLGAVVGSPELAHGAVIYVDKTAAGADNGLTWADAFSDLQDALGMAATGDEIWVAAGTYAPAGTDGDRAATFQLVSGVEIYGGFSGNEVQRDQRNPTANVTTLTGDLNANDVAVPEPRELASEPTRADNSYHVVTGSGSDGTALMDGFIITGGYANNGRGHDSGAGMINVGSSSTSGPTLINCTFEWNFAQRNGGGIYNVRGNLTLRQCTFRHNHSQVLGWTGALEEAAGVGGGGMHSSQSDFVLIDCAFIGNTSNGQGGAIVNVYQSPLLIGCQFVNNEVFGTGERHSGGAVWTREVGTPMLIDCAFLGNRAQAAGGMLGVHDSDPTLVNCLFSGNVGVGSGGYAAGFAINTANATLINCTLSGNISEGPGQAGAGIYAANQDYLDIANCVIWGNRANGVSNRATQIYSEGQACNINHSCVQGGWDGGIGNIDLDPLFLDADGPDDLVGTPDDDLRLALGSPCIDVGDSAILPPDTPDLDGDGETAEAIPLDLALNPRLLGSTVDMGAYEAASLIEPFALSIERAVRLRWPVTDGDHVVLGATSVDGPWEEVPLSVIETDGFYQATVPAEHDAGFFQLVEIPTASVVTVPAGSVDALTEAISSAGPGGTVTLESGMHQETGSVLVNIPLTIQGEPGAILESATTPVGPPPPFVIEAALHVKGTHDVLIEGIELRHSGANGGTAVVIEDSPRVSVVNNLINDYQFGVIIQRGDFAEISGNGIHMDPDYPGSRGIQTLNGRFVRIVDNETTGGFIGIFLADAYGQCQGNRVSGASIGFMQCKALDGVFVISGGEDGSQVFSHGWQVKGNEVFDNEWGFMVIDGAYDNLYVNNTAENNSMYDIELVGDTTRFGVFEPFTHDNVVVQESNSALVVKDCGEDNIVSGDATLVDHEADPCL